MKKRKRILRRLRRRLMNRGARLVCLCIVALCLAWIILNTRGMIGWRGYVAGKPMAVSISGGSVWITRPEWAVTPDLGIYGTTQRYRWLPTFTSKPLWWALSVPLWTVALLFMLVYWKLVREGRDFGERRCPECNYDLRGVPMTHELICPECGHTQPPITLNA